MKEIKILFEFPIYRTTSSKFKDEIKKRMIELAGHSDYHKLSNFQRRLIDNYSYNWKYNDIIGYIVVHLIATESIGFDLFWADKKKIRRNGQYKIEYKEYFNSMYISIIDGTEYSKLGDLILEKINEISKSKKFQGRHIEINYFEKIKNNIDWKALIAECNHTDP